MTQRLWITKPNRWSEAVETNYFSDRPLKVMEINNGVVLPVISDALGIGGCVCDESFKWQAGLTRVGKNSKFPPDMEGFLSAYKVKKENLIYRAESVVFGGILWHHFGHFLIECMNRLWWFLENPNDPRKIVFTCTAKSWHAAKKEGSFSDFLDLLGLKPERYEIIETPTQFQNIFIPDECARSWEFYTREYLGIYEKLVTAAKEKCQGLPTYEKLYLTHSQWKFSMTCVNEELFETFFTRLGFHVLAPETLPLSQQIYTLANAKEVVTTAGTISHLGLFCQPKTLFAVLTRQFDAIFVPQALIHQAKDLNWHFIDAASNFLYTNHAHGAVNMVFNENFKRFCAATWGEKTLAFCDELQAKTDAENYVRAWVDYYSDPAQFKEIKDWTAFDFVNHMTLELKGISLNKNDYAPSWAVRTYRKIRQPIRLIFSKCAPTFLKHAIKRRAEKSQRFSKILGIKYKP